MKPRQNKQPCPSRWVCIDLSIIYHMNREGDVSVILHPVVMGSHVEGTISLAGQNNMEPDVPSADDAEVALSQLMLLMVLDKSNFRKHNLLICAML